MIKLRITQIFMLFLSLSILTTFVVFIAWLFNSTPDNLYKVWKFLGSCLAVSFLFQLLFGAKIKWS